MKKNKKIVCIIPARLASTRFPSKMLKTIQGRPLLEWVWDAARATNMFDDVIFAIDTQEIADVIKSFGGNYLMTSIECISGTERLVELLMHGKIDADIFVNWQGDEPFISRPMIESLLQTIDNPNEEMWTLKKLIQNPDEIFAPNIAKVVCDTQGFAMYFSRASIPFFRDETDPKILVEKKVHYKHVGLYAFRPSALQKIAQMRPSMFDDSEKLEMLRFLENNLKIRMHDTNYEVFGVDTPDDLIKAEVRAASMRSAA